MWSPQWSLYQGNDMRHNPPGTDVPRFPHRLVLRSRSSYRQEESMSSRRLLPVLAVIALLAVSGIAARSGDRRLQFEARLGGSQGGPPVLTNATGRAEFEVNSAR